MLLLSPLVLYCECVCVHNGRFFPSAEKRAKTKKKRKKKRWRKRPLSKRSPTLCSQQPCLCSAYALHPPPSLSLSTPWFSHSNGHTKIPVFVPKNDVHRGSAQDVRRVVSEERGEIEAILFWMRAPPPLCNARHIFITSNDDEMNSEKWLFKFITAAGEMRDAIGSLFYLLFYFECETMVTSYFPMQEFTSSSSFAFCFSFLGLI